MYSPGDGDFLPNEYYTEVKILYNDLGIYILSVMKDPNPKNIHRVFGFRDQITQADNFAVLINPFISSNNTYMFMVTASGAQIDSNQPLKGGFNWNAVWKSAVQITQTGWVVEMFIPYSALRFQNDKEQVWGINFIRHIESNKEDYAWNYIDKSKKIDIVQFLGRLENLKNINPPTRLSFYPYSSVIHKRFKGQNQTNFSFGMDLKYGLSDNYTLDATLIPDFSDTPYDELQLNLGPYEQYYSEKRQFFTEGFDLFNKGRLFYSRRIGSRPTEYYSVYNELNQNEVIIDNPDNVKLINALKVSGRSKNGLGIGFFNAITNKTTAVIEDTITHSQRDFVTEPYANYNIFVLDYNFKNNSSVSLINTNVLRQGSTRDANVTGVSWNLYGMNNSLVIGGTTALSLVNENNHITKGFKNVLYGRKNLKEHNFGWLIFVFDDKYDINDLGFSRKNNFANVNFNYNYNILKPTKHFNSFRVGIELGFDHSYTPFLNVQNDIEINFFATNKKFLSYGMGIVYVTDSYDYYEPRVSGRYYLDKKRGGVWGFISTDYRKKLAIDAKIVRFTKFNDPQNYVNFSFSPIYRFNNQFKINYSFDFDQMNNGKGFVDIVNNNIIFGNRQQKSFTNSLNANYYFNTYSGINLSFRYYWVPVHYDKFYKLEDNGTLTFINTYNQNKDINYNIWNFDLGYQWEFAPGSKLSLLYRNTIFKIDKLSQLTFNENFDNLMSQPQEHNFIMKIIYYIDYNTIINKWF